MKKHLIGAALLLSSVVFLLGGATAATVGPAMPTNLEVVGATETSITLAWGPAQPGAQIAFAETKNSLSIRWGASQDSRSAITYTVYRDGKLAASGLITPEYVVNGLSGRKVSSFQLCIEAVNAAGQKSPQSCSTWSRV
jgi:hypothetical protein